MRWRGVAIRPNGRNGDSGGIAITVLPLIIPVIARILTVIAVIYIAGFIDSRGFDIVSIASGNELSGHVSARACISRHHC